MTRYDPFPHPIVFQFQTNNVIASCTNIWKFNMMAESRVTKDNKQQPESMLCEMEAAPSSGNCNPIVQGLVEMKKCDSVCDTELYKLMKPFMIYMEMFAVFHKRPLYGQDEVSNGSRWEKVIGHCKRITRCLWNVFPFTFVLACGATTIVIILAHYTIYFEMELIGMSVEIVIYSHFIENCFGILYMYYHCRSGKCLQLFQQYSLLAKYKMDKRHLDKVVIRTSRITIVICLTMCLFITICKCCVIL